MEGRRQGGLEWCPGHSRPAPRDLESVSDSTPTRSGRRGLIRTPVDFLGKHGRRPTAGGSEAPASCRRHACGVSCRRHACGVSCRRHACGVSCRRHACGVTGGRSGAARAGARAGPNSNRPSGSNGVGMRRRAPLSPSDARSATMPVASVSPAVSMECAGALAGQRAAGLRPVGLAPSLLTPGLSAPGQVASGPTEGGHGRWRVAQSAGLAETPGHQEAVTVRRPKRQWRREPVDGGKRFGKACAGACGRRGLRQGRIFIGSVTAAPTPATPVSPVAAEVPLRLCPLASAASPDRGSGAHRCRPEPCRSRAGR